jgi:hypothetical protein
LGSGVDTGSREENASKQEVEPRSDSTERKWLWPRGNRTQCS